MTDEAGNLLWYADYKGWGGIREAHNLKGAHQPFRLQNQYVDEETGLHYNLFRYYGPHIGRFTQQDPIGLAGGNNLYRFEGTVQNQVDPLGLDTYMCTRGLGKPSGSWSLLCLIIPIYVQVVLQTRCIVVAQHKMLKLLLLIVYFQLKLDQRPPKRIAIQHQDVH